MDYNPMTVEDIYNDILKRLAQARTLLLSGGFPMKAYTIYTGATTDYIRFESLLKDCAGHGALMESFDNTTALLSRADEEKGGA